MEKKQGLAADAGRGKIPPEFSSILAGHDLKDFNRKRYQESYERYVEEIREPFRKLQQACFADPERTEEILKEACEMVLDGAQAELDKPMIRRGFHSKAIMKDTYKMWIVAYLTPAVYELEYSISQDFNEALRQAWLLRYPGDSYELVKAEAVRKGFEWSWKKWLGI